MDDVKKERLAREIAEKNRPSLEKRFYGGDGEGGARDYHAHKQRFKHVTDIDGLNDRAVCDELRYWFGGVAWRIIEGWAESRDAKRALVHVWADLDECFGQEELSPQDRLSDILETGGINEENPEELLWLAADLRTVYFRAEEIGRQHQLDDHLVLGEVLETKVPHFHERFLEFMIERKQREKDMGKQVEKTNMNHLIGQLKARAKLLIEKRKGGKRGATGGGGGGGAGGGGGG